MGVIKIAVIGVGRYGSAIARKLAEKGAEVYAFDTDPEKLDEIKDEVALAVEIDATDKKVLMSQKIDQMDAAIVAIGENFEATVLTSLNLLDFNIPRVIARASGDNQYRILEKIGVQEILLPEMEVASNMSERLVNPNITAFLQLPDDYEIAEIKTPKGVAERTIGDVGLDKKYNLTLITLKRAYEMEKDGKMTKVEHIIGVPRQEQVIYESDTLVVFGMRKDVQKFIEINA